MYSEVKRRTTFNILWIYYIKLVTKVSSNVNDLKSAILYSIPYKHKNKNNIVFNYINNSVITNS